MKAFTNITLVLLPVLICIGIHFEQAPLISLILVIFFALRFVLFVSARTKSKAQTQDNSKVQNTSQIQATLQQSAGSPINADLQPSTAAQIPANLQSSAVAQVNAAPSHANTLNTNPPNKASNIVSNRSGLYIHLFLLIGSLCLFLASFVLNQALVMLYYPVMVNGVFFIFFTLSLFTTPIAEIFARLYLKSRGQPFTVNTKRYTFKVTIAWCIFFVVNGLIAYTTIQLNDLTLWTLYNGIFSYILIGLMFSVEWLIRRKVSANDTSEVLPN